MYPFGGLPENLAAFAARLRREYGFHIGSGELHEAARALEVVGVASERAVRNALRPIFSRNLRDADLFDETFTAFFFPAAPGIAQPHLPARRDRERSARDDPSDRVRDETAAHEDAADRGGASDGGDGGDRAIESSEPDSAAEGTLTLARYSPLEAERPAARPPLGRADQAWRDAARTLVRRIELGLARRWRPAPTGRRFDLRRTWRASLRTGGEALAVHWLQRPKRAPRFVLLVDGSRSMAEAASTALTMGIALASATSRVEVFTFSTGLERVTGAVRAAAGGAVVRIGSIDAAWGGGTAIGASLRRFLQQFGDRLLDRDTLILIASDGLDVGETEVLRAAMQEIRRRSAAVVWLNPLLETPGYEPISQGMLAARASITTLASITGPSSLLRLKVAAAGF